MKVSNMLSPKGNRVHNQFIIELKGFTVFQSYATLIAVYDWKTATLYQDEENYSRTTNKYLKMFKEVYKPMKTFKVENRELHKIIKGA